MRNIRIIEDEYANKWNIDEVDEIRCLFDSYDYHAFQRLARMFTGDTLDRACRELELAKGEVATISLAIDAYCNAIGLAKGSNGRVDMYLRLAEEL